MTMKKHELTVVFVDYKTPELANILINSFKKFVTQDFNLKFVIVENSDFDLKSQLDHKECVVINNPINDKLSHAHGKGLEVAKKLATIDSEYVFTSHSDICVTSSSFFDELKKCIEDDVSLAGISEDKDPIRVRALHSSGLFVKADLFKKISLLPRLPKIDTADDLTLHCRENGLKMRLFKNTYNDAQLVEVINSPFKELGPHCGVDRCIDSKNNVMLMHQGRGTTKYTLEYNTQGKLKTFEWIKLCNSILES